MVNLQHPSGERILEVNRVKRCLNGGGGDRHRVVSRTNNQSLGEGVVLKVRNWCGGGGGGGDFSKKPLDFKKVTKQ
jgi:hypothetical protein